MQREEEQPDISIGDLRRAKGCSQQHSGFMVKGGFRMRKGESSGCFLLRKQRLYRHTETGPKTFFVVEAQTM